MKKDKQLKERKKSLKVAIVALIVLIVGFGTWLIIRVCTMDVKLEQAVSFELPKFASLANLYELGYGDYAVAIDGEVVTNDNEPSDEKIVRPTASTAKMILGLAVMEAKPFNVGEQGEMITIGPEYYGRYAYYVANGGSSTRVWLGEEISEYDALISVFLASSNNMADTLAMWVFGSLESYHDYASKMLERMRISHTTIGPDASGFSAETTSTAEDLAQIGYLVKQNPVLAEIVATKSSTVPVAGLLENTNKLLGQNGINGIKTGWIGDASGYCLVSSYSEGSHDITVALLGAPSREASFDDSLAIVNKMQDLVKDEQVAKIGDEVGYYDSWWTGKIAIRATEGLKVVGWEEAEQTTTLEMDGRNGTLKIQIGTQEYTIAVVADDYAEVPTLGEKIAHAFGWSKLREEASAEQDSAKTEVEPTKADEAEAAEEESRNEIKETNTATDLAPVTNVPSTNCTIKYGYLMLINPNFTVTTDFIDARRSELVSVSSLYGIKEGNAYNGDNLLDAEAAVHLNEMVKAYEAEYPGHTFETRSCYRARGTTCGRLCAATGTSDHHTGLTCDLLDPAYGTALDTDTYSQHIDWQWLYNNSYKYGFIDRFPAEWAGGPMSEPLNVDENGSTGLFETWHYRYVGVGPATEIATGKYNNGNYDSLEHYLKARGLVTNLKAGTCE